MPTVWAEPIAVRESQGQIHGFMMIRSASGTLLGHGEFSQSAKGDRVSSRFTLHFRDGSIDDETTVFTQRGTFALVSDRHIQRGPFFPHPIDATIAADGESTVKTVDKDGKEKVETSHVEMPADVSNGFFSTILTNLPAKVPEFRLGIFLAVGKGRLAQVRVTQDEKSSFAVVGTRRTVNVFRMHVELGGVAGVVAPLVGKAPADTLVYVLEGDSPSFVREVGQIAEDTPIISIELAGTTFTPFVGRAK